MDFENTVGRLEERLEYLSERNAILDRRLRGIQRVAQATANTWNLTVVLDAVVEVVTSILDAERATVFLVDDETGDLVARALVAPEIKELRVKPPNGIAGWVAANGKSVNIKDAYKDKRFDPSTDKTSGFVTRSILCVPMKTYWGRISGVIQVLNKTNGYFTTEDSDLLATIATQATISIEAVKYFGQLQHANLHLRETQENLRRSYEHLETLYAIQVEMTQKWELSTLVDGVLNQLQSAVPSGLAAVLLTAPTSTLRFLPHAAPQTSHVAPAEPGPGLLYDALTQKRAIEQLTPLADVDSRLIHSRLDAVAVAYLVHPIQQSDGTVTGVLGIFNRWSRDPYSSEDSQLVRIVATQLATALERLAAHQELLRSSNLALIGQAVSGVFHDIKTPLNIISGYAQLLECEQDIAKRSEFADEVVRQTKFIYTMMQEVLAFSRGDRQVFMRPVYLQDFLTELEKVLNKEFEGRGIELVIENEFRDKIKADEGKLKRMLFNLAVNARDAMPSGGRFAITVRPGNKSVDFSVSDTGHGIPQEVRERMFQSFVTRGKVGGTGLGLAIVKSIVDQHGGSIGYTTGNDGTTFSISLPTS